MSLVTCHSTMSSMRTVGQILKETREAKFFTLDEVEKATKIRKEMLKALEADDYTKLPPPTFVQGFIKNYARFLNLDAQKLLAVFRRGFASDRVVVMDAFTKPVGDKKTYLTPSRLIGVAVSLMILSFFVYLWFQYHQYVGTPKLELASPADQYTTDSASVTVEGKTDPEVKVSINSQEVPVDLNGGFREEVAISSQVNKITIVATSKLGQSSTVERTVYQKR